MQQIITTKNKIITKINPAIQELIHKKSIILAKKLKIIKSLFLKLINN
jgi:hypothetical protein